jgi:hypothetical protein
MKRCSTISSAHEEFVARLVEAVYPVALEHRASGSWVELELELWKAVDAVVSERSAGSDVDHAEVA